MTIDAKTIGEEMAIKIIKLSSFKTIEITTKIINKIIVKIIKNNLMFLIFIL
jgi:hypothetical protein